MKGGDFMSKKPALAMKRPKSTKRNPVKSHDSKVFFAVTMTSVYRVVLCGTKKSPYMVKIAYRGGESSVKIRERIDNGAMVSIGKRLIMFFPDGHSFLSSQTSYERDIAKVNTQWWRGGTSNIVALFSKKRDAFECNVAKNLVFCDPRWKDNTIAVLRAIGDEHPYCSITDFLDLRLMPKSEWA